MFWVGVVNRRGLHPLNIFNAPLVNLNLVNSTLLFNLFNKINNLFAIFQRGTHKNYLIFIYGSSCIFNWEDEVYYRCEIFTGYSMSIIPFFLTKNTRLLD